MDLLLRDDELIWLVDTYRWLDCATFAIVAVDKPPAIDEVLDRLITDRHYVDAYQYASETAGKVSARQQSELMFDYHGPYRYSVLSRSSFERLDGPSARNILRDWLLGESPVKRPDREAEDGLQVAISLAERLAAAPVVFRLKRLGEDAMHDSGYAVDAPFLELIVINVQSLNLQLIFGGGD